jgi:hypothetical protein
MRVGSRKKLLFQYDRREDVRKVAESYHEPNGRWLGKFPINNLPAESLVESRKEEGNYEPTG